MRTDEFTDEMQGCLVPLSGTWAFNPPPLPPKLKWTAREARIVSEASATLGELAGVGRTLTNPHLLIKPMIRREATLSSKIEGTQASLSDLLFFEARPIETHNTADVLEVLNYVITLEYGLQRQKYLPISIRFIRELHAKLMHNVRGKDCSPGEFRRTQNWIGAANCSLEDAAFVPPPIREMQEALQALEKYIHTESDLPPLVRLALIHYQFEAIHPFLDGNGRLGRLLITLLLSVEDILPQPLLYLSAYFWKNREAYYSHLLGVSHAGKWQSWIDFFLQGIIEQSKDAAVRSKRLLDLHARISQSIQQARSSALLLKILDRLFHSPFITVSDAQKFLDVSYGAANSVIGKLVDAGVLHMRDNRKRNRIFYAKEIIDCITEDA